MNRVQRLQRAKSHFYADAADEIEASAGDTAIDTAEALGVDVVDVLAAAEAVAAQLRTMAARSAR